MALWSNHSVSRSNSSSGGGGGGGSSQGWAGWWWWCFVGLVVPPMVVLMEVVGVGGGDVTYRPSDPVYYTTHGRLAPFPLHRLQLGVETAGWRLAI